MHYVTIMLRNASVKEKKYRENRKKDGYNVCYHFMITWHDVRIMEKCMTLQKEYLTDADTVTLEAGQLFAVQALFIRKAASRMSLWINKQLKCTLF